MEKGGHVVSDKVPVTVGGRPYNRGQLKLRKWRIFPKKKYFGNDELTLRANPSAFRPTYGEHFEKSAVCRKTG